MANLDAPTDPIKPFGLIRDLRRRWRAGEITYRDALVTVDLRSREHAVLRCRNGNQRSGTFWRYWNTTRTRWRRWLHQALIHGTLWFAWMGTDAPATVEIEDANAQAQLAARPVPGPGSFSIGLILRPRRSFTPAPVAPPSKGVQKEEEEFLGRNRAAPLLLLRGSPVEERPPPRSEGPRFDYSAGIASLVQRLAAARRTTAILPKTY